MKQDKSVEELEPCGIVMPISAFGAYEAQHWALVRDVVDRAISEAGFRPVPVWEHSSTDIIQSRIVRNLYDLPIIVCDISGLNPNVMFELGLRIAFKKPIVLLVDELTKIPFDTNSIEHLIYVSTLQFHQTETLITNLSEKIRSVWDAHNAGNYEAFIDTFGAFSTFEPSTKNIKIDDYLSQKLDDIAGQVANLRHESRLLQSIVVPQMTLGRTATANALANVNALNSSPPIGNDWTAAKEAKLIEMWEEGRTASQIADALGEISKNAVIGKAYRLGLKPRPAPSK